MWLGLAAKIFPVGAAIPWFTDVAPSGFAIMKNQAFDVNLYTELAKVFPSGVIPGMRGCGVIGKEDGEDVGVYEEGQVKQHGHPNSSIASTDLGSKRTSAGGAHMHSQTLYKGNDINFGGYPMGTDDQYGSTSTANIHTGGIHDHVTVMGAHAHTVFIALFGSPKNTINHRKVNWIVRMA